MRELTGQQVVDAIRTETEKTLEALNGYVPTLAIVRVCTAAFVRERRKKTHAEFRSGRQDLCVSGRCDA